MTKIIYIKGDATNPVGEGNKIIVHICNNMGYWAKGFVLAISKRWKEPEAMYRRLKERPLGGIQLVTVTDKISVANMIAQHDIKPDAFDFPPIRYTALSVCLKKVNEEAIRLNATIHMPRIGTGLAGGSWSRIESIIQDVVSVDVYVYDLK